MFRVVHSLVGVATVVIGVISLSPTAAVEAAKPITWAGRLVIDNPVGGPERVIHDCANPEGQTECSYTDYQLPAGDPCVESYLPTTGLAMFRLNRRFDPAVDVLCNEQGPAYVARTYTLRISSSYVCVWLGLSITDGSCDYTAPVDRNPMIRAETVFKNKATKTRVNFIFADIDGGGTYHVLTDQEVPMTGTSNSKTVIYSGTATITNLQGTITPTSFPLPFMLRFDRFAL
jgi:hypothetical protein